MTLDEHLLGCVADGPCPSPTAHRRLGEAHLFWHRCLDGYQDPVQFRADLNACIQALRNVTFALQKEMAHTDGFAEWYADWRTAMGRSKIMKWSLRARNIVVKEGDLATESSVRALVTMDYFDVASAVARDLADPSVPTELHPSVLASVDEIREMALERHIPEEHRQFAFLNIERQWIDSELPDVEILNALAYVFSFLSCVVLDADVQFSRTPPAEDLDPATAGLEGDPYPRALRPGCMVTTRASRSTRVGLYDGKEDIGGKSWPAEFDPEVVDKAVEMYGPHGASFAPVAGRDALDFVEPYARNALAILKSGQQHGWFMFFFRESRVVHTEILMARDKADKYVLAQQVAEIAARVGADGVVEMGEMWIHRALKDSDGLLVGYDHSVKPEEALGVYGETVDGRGKGIIIRFDRTFYGAVTIHGMEPWEGMSNFLAPLRAVWRGQIGASGADERS